MKYYDRTSNRIYNTDTSVLLKYSQEMEELGDGYIRYSTRWVYRKERRENEYFLHVNKTTVDRRCNIFDVQDYFIPVDEEWVRSFRRDTPEIWPE